MKAKDEPDYPEIIERDLEREIDSLVEKKMKTGEKRQTSGLSLAEAHASGRKYRRALSGQGNIKMSFYYRFGEQQYMSLTIADALATDYELKPEAKLLTRDEVTYLLLDKTMLFQQTIDKVCDALFGEEDV